MAAYSQADLDALKQFRDDGAVVLLGSAAVPASGAVDYSSPYS